MTPEEIRSQVFGCTHCETVGLPFVRNSSGKFYRFPPTIGAVGLAPLLFVGINPRVSASNQPLHDTIVDDAVRFGDFARNRVGASTYIGTPGLEKHYALHVRVVHALYPGALFEQVAAVTELHYCASASSVGLPLNWSRCADRFFRSVLELISPAVIFVVGARVEQTLRGQFGSDNDGVLTWSTGRASVIALPHPNSFGPKRVRFNTAVAKARHQLQTNGPPRASGAQVESRPAQRPVDARSYLIEPPAISERVMTQRDSLHGGATVPEANEYPPSHLNHLVRRIESSGASAIKGPQDNK